MPSLKDAATSSNNQSNNSYERKKTLGFINFSLPGGGKLGFMSISEDFEAIHEKLMSDPELLKKFLSNLVVDYRANVKAEKKIDIDSLFS